eukprot:SM000222S06957  [mRNA]  locus=s222:24773:25634:+ [translate_table: standard]
MAPAAAAAAAEALRAGRPVAILDSAAREAEVDLFFGAAGAGAGALRRLRADAGGELYIAVGADVAALFGLPFLGAALASPGLAPAWPLLARLAKAPGDMCQGSCSVSLSLDHRSTHTGAPDAERALTCRRLAQLYLDHASPQPAPSPAAMDALGAEFHTPGHIFLCAEAPAGLAARAGHTELAVALARHAGVPPLMVGCVMLSNSGDDYGALPADKARVWAAENGVPFITGADIIALGSPGPPLHKDGLVNGSL